MCGACDGGWRVETFDLVNTRVRRVIHPLSMDFSEVLTGVGQGTINLPVLDGGPQDFWPNRIGVVCSYYGDGYENDPTVWVGFIEAAPSNANGVLTVGVKHIHHYLHRRHLFMAPPGNSSPPLRFDDIPQTKIAQTLADLGLTQPNNNPGPGIVTVDGGSLYNRDRQYNPWDHSNIGEMLANLAGVINGVEWGYRYRRDPATGLVTSTCTFVDRTGDPNTGVVLRSDRDLLDFSLDLDGKDHSNRVRAVGEGQEVDQLEAYAADPSSGLWFDSVPAWQDVSRASTLSQHAHGYLRDQIDPFASPGISLPMTPRLYVGDVIELSMAMGVIGYQGPARVLEVAYRWDESGTTRTVGLLPLSNASQTVKHVDGCGCGCGCLPEQPLFELTDHGNGTWSITGPESSFSHLGPFTWEAKGVSGTWVDPETYTIETTED